MITRRTLLQAPVAIARENLKPGTSDWQLTKVRPTAGKGYRSALIEGYCRQQSIATGQTLEICLSAQPARRATIDEGAAWRRSRLNVTSGPSVEESFRAQESPAVPTVASSGPEDSAGRPMRPATISEQIGGERRIL